MTGEMLDIWLYGTHVAQLPESSRAGISLTWTPDGVERWGRGARLLSAKLAVGEDPVGALVRTYLDGLLPEGNARVNHALTAGVAPDDTFALISAFGRDTPGAAIFVPAGHGDPTRAGRYEPLTSAEVAERLRRADQHRPASPAGATESSTLPGMVPKVTLHRADGRWFACKDGAASTWILKRAAVGGGELDDVIDTEVACLALARTIGLTTIEAEVVDFGDVRAIAVSRYDRLDSRANARIHQEDLAQALGLNTLDPNRKFQWGSAMPSLRQAADVLRLDGGDPDDLLRLVTFSFLVGNTDMHAKNISFLRHADGRAELSPAYDIAMHLHHRRENRRFALDIDSRSRVDDLSIADVVTEGRSWGLPPRRALRVVAGTTTALARSLERLDRTRHPGVPGAAWAVLEQRVEDAIVLLGDAADASPHRDPVDDAARPARPGRRGPRRPTARS